MKGALTDTFAVPVVDAVERACQDTTGLETWITTPTGTRIGMGIIRG